MGPSRFPIVLAGILIVVAAGLSVSTGLLYREAQRTHDEAETARLEVTQAQQEIQRLEAALDSATAGITDPRPEPVVEAPEVAAAVPTLADLLMDRLRAGDLQGDMTLTQMLDDIEAAIQTNPGLDPIVEVTWRTDLSRLHRAAGGTEKAMTLAADAHGLAAAELGPDHPLTLTASAEHGAALQALGRYERAETLLRDMVARSTRALGPDHPVTAALMTRRALVAAADPERADTIELLEAAATALNGRDDVVDASISIDLYHALGTRLIGAEQARGAAMLEIAAAIAAAEYGPRHPRVVLLRRDVGVRRLAMNDAAAATKPLREAVFGARFLWGTTDERSAEIELLLAQALAESGVYEEAVDTASHVAGALTRELGPSHPRVLAARLQEASCLVAADRHADAERLLRDLHPRLEATLGPTDPETLASVELLVRVLDARDQTALASEYRRLLPDPRMPEK